MANLRCKTRGNSSPQGKPRVYFCCHSNDFNEYFESVSDEILTKQNCAIWYVDEAAVRDEDFFADLKQMQLFVMPVTTNLLCTENEALDTEFKFAIENHIPVLPLMQESGLEELFNKKCGDLQFLDKNNADVTTISYDEKLKKYLESVLIGDELAEKIRAAFDAYVFLSYRKKDRKYAQELMRLIHKNEFCRDIAIWYDEFLTPGENFNDSIKEALQKSGLFVLTVTPNLVNEPNYIMTTEYPMAKQEGKPILPAELVPTDREQLSEKYEDIPNPADAHNESELSEALLESIKKMAVKENDNSPEHNFFIGLAYLSGIDVEVDHERAVVLITSAAELGLIEAMDKIAEIYEKGIGVKQNCIESIKWRIRISDAYKTAIINHIKEQDKILKRMENMERDSDGFLTRESLEVNYNLSKCLMFQKSALEEPVQKWNEAQLKLSELYYNIGKISESKLALIEMLDFAKTNEKYYTNDISFTGIFSGAGNVINTSYFDLFIKLSHYCIKEKNYEEAMNWLIRANEWLKILDNDTNNKLLRLCIQTKSVEILIELQDYPKADSLLRQIENEYTEIFNESDIDAVTEQTNLYFNDKGKIFAPIRDVEMLHGKVLVRLGNIDEAIETYQDAIKANKNAAGEEDTVKEIACRLELMYLFALLRRIEAAEEQTSVARELLKFSNCNSKVREKIEEEYRINSEFVAFVSMQMNMKSNIEAKVDQTFYDEYLLLISKIETDFRTTEWQTTLFNNEHLPFDKIYESEEQVRNSIIFPYGGFFSKDVQNHLLKKCLLASIKKIAYWFIQTKERRLRMEFNFAFDVGYTVSSSIDDKKSSRSVVLTVRRDDKKATKYGFYISAFNII